MEDNKIYIFPVNEEKAKEMDIEYNQKGDLSLFLFPETKKFGEAFWGTMDEINQKTSGCPWNVIFNVSIKYYKEWFGKKNVIRYNDGKMEIIQCTENGETYVFDFYGSRNKGKYIWREASRLDVLNPYIDELSKRLKLEL